MRRTFIAININPDNRLKQLIKELKAALSVSRIKWVETENLHITLAFLGDTDEYKIGAVRDILRSTCSSFNSFPLELRDIGLFRSLKDPRVIWLGVCPSKELADLREAICIELFESSIYNDSRPFRPHLTIGRPKHLKEISKLSGIISETRNKIIQTSIVDKVIFYESILKQEGPVYRVLGEYSLA